MSWLILILLAVLLPFGVLLALGVGFIFLAARRPGIFAVSAGLLALLLSVTLFALFALHYVRKVASDFGGIPDVVRLSSESPALAPSAKPPGGPELANDPSAADRPAWIDEPGQLRGAVYEVAVKSGLYVTAAECQRGLEVAEHEAADDYLESYLGPGAARMVPLDVAFLRAYLQKAEYHESCTTSVGKMRQIHALLQFDDAARRIFRERLRQALVNRSLRITAGCVALALLIIAAAYAYLLQSNRQARAAQRPMATA